ncbi:MAG: antitoxin Xre-like helix-turn-helix domain-containing protein [Planctomycetota bacterium]
MVPPVRARAAAARPDPGLVLARAVLRAADQLGVRQAQLARILGVSEATVSRLAAGRSLSPDSKAGELALLFVRVFRSLDALFGGATEQGRSWLASENAHLGDVPVRMLESAAGLVAVVDYLDAMRGRN